MAFKICVDWENTGTFDGTYDDVTDRVISARWSLGMREAYQLVANESTARIVLNNEDGRYTPENTGSPLHGNLLPHRRCIIVEDVDDVRMWTGWIDFPVVDWSPAGDQTGRTTVEFEGTGPARLLNAATIDLPILTDVTGDEVIADVLVQAQIPPAVQGVWQLGKVGKSELGISTVLGDLSAISRLDPGEVVLATFGDTAQPSAYRTIEDVTKAERGRFFFERDGRAVWWSRNRLVTPVNPDRAAAVKSISNLIAGLYFFNTITNPGVDESSAGFGQTTRWEGALVPGDPGYINASGDADLAGIDPVYNPPSTNSIIEFNNVDLTPSAFTISMYVDLRLDGYYTLLLETDANNYLRLRFSLALPLPKMFLEDMRDGNLVSDDYAVGIEGRLVIICDEAANTVTVYEDGVQRLQVTQPSAWQGSVQTIRWSSSPQSTSSVYLAQLAFINEAISTGDVATLNIDPYAFFDDPVLTANTSSGDNKPTRLSYAYGRDISNVIVVDSSPRRTEASETLWEYDGPPLTVSPGEEVVIRARLRKDNGQFAGASSLVANATFSAGTGSASVDPQGGIAVITISSVNGGTLSALTLSGAPTVQQNDIQVRREDGESIASYGYREFDVDAGPVDDVDDLINTGDFELIRRKDARGVVSEIGWTRQADGVDNAAFIGLNIGDRLRVVADEIGHDADYWLIGEQHEWSPGKLHEITGILERTYPIETFWLLGVSGYSELGQTTVLGY